MNPSKQSSRLLLLYPLAAAALPALLLMLANAAEADWAGLTQPLLFSLVTTLLLLAGLLALYRDYHQAAMVCVCATFAIYGYGHVVNGLVWLDWIAEKYILRFVHLVLLAAVILCAVYAWRRRPNVSWFTQTVGLVIMLLFATTLGQLLFITLQDENRTRSSEVNGVKQQAAARRPDIYYIIPDAYLRADLLRDVFKFDNSVFIAELAKRGFYVADRSYSNYPMTFQSLASSLNLDYINGMMPGPEDVSRKPALDLLFSHKVGRYLAAHGYTNMHFCTGYNPTARSDVAHVSIVPPGFHPEFHRIFLQSTLAWPVVAELNRRFDLRLFKSWMSTASAESHLFFFSKFKDIARDPRPTFTLAHIIAPHPPFVFDRHGNVRPDASDRGWDRQKYLGQLEFLNGKILEFLDDIVRESADPPVIILQADHGPASIMELRKERKPTSDAAVQERLAILNAYRGPEAFLKQLYPSISPVNTFRLLFNTLFDESYTRLEDRHYLPWYDRPNLFVDKTATLQALENASKQK